MFSLKTTLLSACLLISMAGSAIAGHQADYTMSVSMDEGGLMDMASMFGEMGLDSASETPPSAEELMGDIAVVYGKVYWMDGYSRIDMFYDPEMAHEGQTDGLQAGDLVESFIIFEESGTSYQLLHTEKRAVAYDQTMPDSGFGSDDPMPDLQPDRMIRNYDEMISNLQTTEGMEVMELAAATINGVPVQGVSFIMDMQAMMGEMEGMEGMPDLSALMGMGEGTAGDGASSLEGMEGMEGLEGLEGFGGLIAGIMSMMGNIEGELWYSEELDVLMRMNMSLMGINTTMELDSVFDWTDDGTTFVVPDDYELITQEEYMDEQMEQFNKVMEGFQGSEGDYYDPKKDGAKISRDS